MHVWARLAGHGLIIVPQAPFRYTQDPDGLSLEHAGSRARVVCSDPPQLEPGLERVADAERSAAQQGKPWRVQTTTFQACWPPRFALLSEDQPPGFQYLDPFDGFVFLQGPFDGERIPPVSGLIAEGQELVERGESPCPWIGVAYAHDGRTHHQRVFRVPFEQGGVVLLTAQAPATHPDLEALWGGAAEIAESIQPTER